MFIEIDEKSGFCFGVINAINKAEETIAAGNEVYSLGDIVHNGIEVERLEKIGMKTLKHDDFHRLKNSCVLIRAHGEPPATYEIAKENNITIIDATCPVVARLQNLVKKSHKRMKEVGGQVVILGKRGHAEVIGLTGQVNGDVKVIEGMGDLETVDFERPIYFVAQTTQSLSLFNEISEEIKKRSSDPDKVAVNDSICRQVSNREPHLKEFASRYDIVIFVSGRKSSNGKILFEVCRNENPKSYFIEDENEVDIEWFRDARSVGICGATSTPKWLMKQVADYIASIEFN